MSAVIQTSTPFVIESVLIAALQEVGAEPVKVTSETLLHVQGRNSIMIDDILTNRQDYNGRQLFRKSGQQWSIQHDNDEYSARVISNLVDRRYVPITRFLAELEKVYNKHYQIFMERQAEQERIRLEEEKKTRVEAVRQQAIDKARAQGYSVKEKRVGSNIQLVLTRTV